MAEARGLWLDARRLAWPGAPAQGRYRLALSATGALVARPGAPVQGADALWDLAPDAEPWPEPLAARFRHLAEGARLRLGEPAADTPTLRAALRGQLLLVQVDEADRVLQATRLQIPGVLDALYAAAAADAAPPLGVAVTAGMATAVRLWAPTARSVWLCLHPGPQAAAARLLALQPDDAATAAPLPAAASAPVADSAGLPANAGLAADASPAFGTWSVRWPGDNTGHSYTFLVDVWVPGLGLVRQRVTDPYTISLTADSRRAWIGDLASPALMPPGWAAARRPAPLAHSVDMAVYELHVRDFSVNDTSVAPARRGKYLAFAETGSAGMRHLRALARAGLTDVHLLPVFDFATVPERGCSTPAVPDAPPDSLAQQAAVMAQAATDCFNWGYDPLHFNAPEGSYASEADDGARRIVEFRQMVMALHAAGLRVGMDVVYNHLSASGQQPHSVLDRIVPGYYHRLDAAGRVERSTCCDNSATEHAMMGKLMRDSVRLWARQYRIDSFRFDLMGHQPRAEMVRLRAQLRTDQGRDVQLIGEGWNFGEVADGARFVQASQRSLGGAGIGSFSDRGRDALRGGGVGDSPQQVVARRGFLNGQADGADRAAARATADLLRLALAGTLADYRFAQADGQVRRGADMVYAGQSAGYAQQPGEVVNYVENHDNHTLWDVNALKLPLTTSSAERARAQVLGLAVTALSQGIPYFHAGVDLLRSKSGDGNSYDSGDWFNRVDWTGRSNHFGSGLPPAGDNAAFHALWAPRLRDPALRATPADIAFSRRAFQDWLRIRASTRLLRLSSAEQVQQRLRQHNTGPGQNPAVLAVELDGRGLPGARFGGLLLLVNASAQAQSLHLPLQARGARRWRLHPVLRAPGAADARARQAAPPEAATGRVTVPGRTALVYVRG